MYNLKINYFLYLLNRFPLITNFLMQMSGNSALWGNFSNYLCSSWFLFSSGWRIWYISFKNSLCLPDSLHFSFSLHYHKMLITQEICAVSIPHHGLIQEETEAFQSSYMIEGYGYPSWKRGRKPGFLTIQFSPLQGHNHLLTSVRYFYKRVFRASDATSQQATAPANSPQYPFNEALLTAALLSPPERPRQPGLWLVKLLFQREETGNKQATKEAR